ncbi:MAG: hypothetical protein IJ339_01060 [Oscillospiraceae bacterium]|nr:hypothetical protein [Oscillospiraceae bacterium]
MKLETQRCPFCDRYIDGDTKLYRRDNELIGCEYCVVEDYIDEDYDDDEADMEAEAAYYDMLYDLAKEEGVIARMEGRY